MGTASPTPTANATPTSREAVWTPAGELREARSRTHAVLLGSGEVLVVGSDNICEAATAGSDSVEIGEPEAGTWKRGRRLPKPHDRPVLVALPDGRALLTGGLTGEDDGPLAFSSTYVFDPATRSWSRTGLLNTARYDPGVAVLADGRVLVAGGSYIDRRQRPSVLDSSELWDPATGKWSRTGKLLRPRTGGQAVTLADGRVLLVGGVGDRDGEIRRATAEIYDPATGEWQGAGRIDTYRTGFSLVALPDGGALLAGGSEYTDNPDSFPSVGPTSTAERFDPRTGRWSDTGLMKVAAAGRAGVGLADGRVLVAGGDRTEVVVDVVPPEGEPPPTLTAEAEIYDPATGSWQSTVPLPRPRAGASAILLADDSVVLVGGDRRPGPPEDTPSCPLADDRVWRYVPGT
jgi:N-acetylneuraminic acid mutarotase